MSILGFLEGKFFNAFTLFIAIAAIAVTVYFARKTIRADRRRLTISALPAAPLLTSHSKGLANLQLTWNGTPLTDAHIVTFILDNYGRATIDSSSYDRGRPIRLNLGVPVVEIMKVALRPKSASEFVHDLGTNAVCLGPDVLKPSQRLVVQTLVAGEPELADPLEEYLTNTEVEYVRPGASPKFRPRSKSEMLTWLPFVFTFLILGLMVAGLLKIILSPDGVLNFAPRTAVAGQTLEAWGSDFPPNSKVHVSIRCGTTGPMLSKNWEIYPLAEPLTDSAGSFRVRIQVPRVPELDECELFAEQEPDSSWTVTIDAKKDFLEQK